MKELEFFTPEFKKNPQLTLEVLNKLVEDGLVADQDMYQSGRFLFMEVFDNEQTVKILSQLISNIEAYKEYNNKNFVSDDATEIGLCALQDEHRKIFYKESKDIWWNDELDRFVFAEDL